MRIKVIGAGLAGLGVTYFLLKKGHQVNLVHVGSGASEIPIGLCHPYPGRSGKPSQFAYEAIELTRELIGVAEKECGKKLMEEGIIRDDWTPAEWYDDLEEVDGGILIKSGFTVRMGEYVRALRELFGVSEEQECDRVVYASGAAMRAFDLPINFVKGQVLMGPGEGMSRMRAQGHISPVGGGLVQIGSTYEHHFASDQPDIGVAKRDLAKKMGAFSLDSELFTECRAGVRVSVQGTYLPVVRQLDEKSFVFTGLGSRGLLYHAYYGRHLANLIT